MSNLSKLTIRNFLSIYDKNSVREAVQMAESKTSGEIKVLVVGESQSHFPDENPIDAVEKRAGQEFLNMGIQDTVDATGVLVMISLKERRVSIKADKSIDDKVPSGTWESVMAEIISGIRAGNSANGICSAVSMIGDILADHFPIKEGDVNELPDEVSFKE